MCISHERYYWQSIIDTYFHPCCCSVPSQLVLTITNFERNVTDMAELCSLARPLVSAQFSDILQLNR